MQKKSVLFFIGLFLALFLQAQEIEKVINEKEVSRIESALSADDMQGRAIFSAGIDKAADFISNEFRKAGLQKFAGLDSYLQSFVLLSPTLEKASLAMDGQMVNDKNMIVVTTKKHLMVTENSGFKQVAVHSMDALFQTASAAIKQGTHTIFWLDTNLSKNFTYLNYFKRNIDGNAGDVIFVLTAQVPKTFTLEATHSFKEKKLANVVGEIKGKTRPEEYVVFSAHYDHLGIGKPVNGDSIYNGANDDASGTTAVILLANYFKQLNHNNRTLIFVAFTGEESGGFGSKYFSTHLPSEQVVAMFNIEMIGTESKWGTNSAYITGYEKTNMGDILQKNLTGTSFSFHPDPYTSENLFYRSDNATLARLGVPAHTISTSKMDNEPNYHRVTDEIGTLDMKNMTAIIRAIALSAQSIIQGKDTPTRVQQEDLK